MTDTIGWGILATGGIAARFTTELQLLPDARVVAVGSRTVESAKSFAERYEIPRHYGDWDSLIADPEVDIVYVANTHNAHYDAVRRCLAAGKAVLCEKAFTINHAQAAELVELATQRGVFLMEAMWMRCNPAIRQMCAEIADGLIGEVSMLSADFWLAASLDARHRLRDPGQGGGALLDLGVYPISLSQLVLGTPSSVTATGTLTPEGVDSAGGMVFGHDGGAVATLSCGITADGPVTATVAGSKGRITLSAPFFCPSGYTIHRGADTRVVEVPFLGHGMTHEAIEAMRCLREGLRESPLVPLRETLAVMATMDQVRSQLGVKYPGE